MADFTGFTPSYDDYKKIYGSGDQSSFSESGASNLPSQITEEQWTALSDADKWTAMGGLGPGGASTSSLSIDPNDPRYADLAPLFMGPGQTDNNPSLTFTYDPNYQGQAGRYLDPNLVHSAGGVYGFSSANESPEWKNQRAEQNAIGDWPALALLSILTMGATGAFAGVGAGLEGGTDAAITGAEVGSASEGASLYGAGADLGAADATLTADLGGAGVGAGAAGGAEGLDLSLLPATSAGDITPLVGDPAALADIPGLDLSPIGSTPGGDTSFLSSSSGSGDLGFTPGDFSGIPNDVTLQPPPNVDVPTPEFNVEGPGIGQSMLDTITKNPMRSAGLGLSLAQLVGAHRAGSGVPGQLRDAAKPISDQAAALLGQYGKGQLNPGDEWGINKWESDQVARVKSYYASAGQGDSTAALNAVSQVEAQAQGMRDKALQGLLQAGLQASGMALGPLEQAIIEEGKNDQAFQSAEANALRALFQLFGGSPSSTTTTTTTTGGP